MPAGSSRVRCYAIRNLQPLPISGRRRRSIGDLDHLEQRFWRAAIRTHPIVRDILPPRPGSDLQLGETERFVIKKAAAEAQIALHRRRWTANLRAGDDRIRPTTTEKRSE